jgi:YD repeat-containing protein
VLIPGIDYFPLGYKITALDNGLVAATIPGKHQIALFNQVPVGLIFNWQEIGNFNTTADVTALDTIEIGGQKQLTYVDGNHLYLQQTTPGTARKNLGIVGTSQTMTVGDLDMDGNSDIAVADYNQNLHVFLLNADGTVKDVQTSKINTKPRDIQIFDWNQDGKNDVLIADGGSGLDLKINQYDPTPSTTPISLLHTKFEYDYALAYDGTLSDRILEKTQTDIVENQLIPTTRKTISTYDSRRNLTQVEVTGSNYGLDYTSGTNTATTHTHYNFDGTIEYTLDANNNETKFLYYNDPAPYLNKQIKSIERGAGTLDQTFEYYDYYTTRYIKDIKDGRGNTTHYDYDALNRITQITKSVTSIDPVTLAPTTTQNITKTQYYKTGWVKSTTDANTHQTEDAFGRQTVVKDPLAYRTLMSYDLVGNVKSTTDANLKTTYYDYDSLNRKISDRIDVNAYDVVSDSLVSSTLTTSYKYDENNNLILVTDPLGRVTQNDYDELNRRIATTNAVGTPDAATSRYGYDGVGNLTYTTDANNHTTKSEYDDVNRQNKVTDALGKVISEKIYDPSGRVVSSTNEYGEVTTTAYTGLHLITATNSLGNSIQETDAMGNVIYTRDAAGRVSTYKYDSLNRQTYAKDYRGGETFSIYDDFGNLAGKTDASLNVFSYKYDRLNRLVRSSDSLGLISRVGYDNVENKTHEYLTVNNGDERHNTYVYDELNRQYQMTTAVGTPAAATMLTSYDKVGFIRAFGESGRSS